MNTVNKVDKTKPIISIKNLTKSFSGKTVVSDVSFDLYPGEILALCGENGAGKSTTKNMLCGLLKPDSGHIVIDGEEVAHINNIKCGIGVVHQELSLFKSLTVAANICISELPGKAAKVDWDKASEIAQKQLDELGLDVSPNTIVETLGTGKQQIVEIAKAMMHADKVLILDEPTTSLTKPERDKLFSIMNDLRKKGIAIIFISHFMDEIFQMCDSYIVLRDGKQVDFGKIKDIERRRMEELMVGRSIQDAVAHLHPTRDEVCLKVENLSSPSFINVNFEVKKGEIFGIGGLVGAGRTEIIESIYGMRATKGNVYLDGELMNPINVKKMKNKGVCYITEDRKISGIFASRSVRENISSAFIDFFLTRKIKGYGFKGEEASTNEQVKEMNIAIPSLESKVNKLSGGNQQKVILGRWLCKKPNLLILDEPSKGVDIGAKYEIHERIVKLAGEGVAVIVVSSDLQELISLSHRIAVMRTGQIVGEYNREDFDPVKIISLAASSAYDGKEV